MCSFHVLFQIVLPCDVCATDLASVRLDGVSMPPCPLAMGAYHMSDHVAILGCSYWTNTGVRTVLWLLMGFEVFTAE